MSEDDVFVEEVAVETDWACPQCTFQNQAGELACQVCGYTVEGGDYSYGGDTGDSDDEDEDEGEQSQSDDSAPDDGGEFDLPWECPACTYNNDAEAFECEMCGMPRS